MEVKSWVDAELLHRMFPQTDRPFGEMESAWREFITRYEKIIIKAIRLTYRRYPGLEALKHEELLQLVQQIFKRISEDDYRALRGLCNKESDSIKLYLYSVAANTALDFFKERNLGQKAGINSLLSRIKKRLILFYKPTDLTQYQR